MNKQILEECLIYINFEEDNCGDNSKWSIYRVYE